MFFCGNSPGRAAGYLPGAREAISWLVLATTLAEKFCKRWLSRCANEKVTSTSTKSTTIIFLSIAARFI